MVLSDIYKWKDEHSQIHLDMIFKDENNNGKVVSLVLGVGLTPIEISDIIIKLEECLREL